MTNTHRKTTTRTTAKIAAVGAFGIGAAIAFPGLAAAQDAPTTESPTASLENLGGDEGSLGDGLGTEIAVDAGSLSLNFNLDAEAPNPGSVEFGSVGVSPNTGSAVIDGDTGSGSADEDADDDAAAETGSLDTGSLPGSSDDSDDDAETGEDTGSAASSEDDTTPTGDEAEETGSIDTGSLAGLSSGADEVAV